MSEKKVAVRGRRMKRLGCGCLSLLIALGIGVLVLEWILRANVAHFLGAPAAAEFMYEMDDERSFRLKPGWNGEQSIDGRTTTIHINARGMRGPEIGTKSAGERRVLVLGDSLVWGQGIDDDETIPARLQHHLGREAGGAVAVLNAGVPGYGTNDFVPSFARHRDVGADLVIACTYLGNDFADDCRQYSAVIEGYRLDGPLARAAHTSGRFRLTLRYRTAALLEHLFLRFAPSLAFDRSQLQSTPEEIEAFALFPPKDQQFAGLFFDRRADDALVAKVLYRCRANYVALAARVAPVPVLHVIIPTWWHLSEKVWQAELSAKKLDVGAHEWGAAQRRLLAVAADLGLEMIDLTPLLIRAKDRESLWLPTDRHLSAAGCDRAAAWLLPHVRGMLAR